MNRKQFLQRLALAGAGLAGTVPLMRAPLAAESETKRPRAIAMWDFSWLERRWPGAGYEDWDQALDELAVRGRSRLVCRRGSARTRTTSGLPLRQQSGWPRFGTQRSRASARRGCW